MSVLPDPNEKRARVQQMFDRIAPRYDALNRLLTAGLDQRWRRLTLTLAKVGQQDRVLDLACGTGDLVALSQSRGARVIGLDFAAGMLRRARRRAVRAPFVQGDAACLPLADKSVSVVTCGFALRNFVALPQVLAELARVLAPGGRIALLDVDRPDRGWVRSIHSLHFDRIIPFVGGVVSDRAAYRYLPASTVYLPAPEEMHRLLEAAGFVTIQKRRLLLGSAQILTGVRA